MHLPILDISCKWNPTACGLLGCTVHALESTEPHYLLGSPSQGAEPSEVNGHPRKLTVVSAHMVGAPPAKDLHDVPMRACSGHTSLVLCGAW